MHFIVEWKNSQFPQHQLLPNHFAEAGKTFIATAAEAEKIKAGSGLLQLPEAGTRLDSLKEDSHRHLGERKLHIDKIKISNVKAEITSLLVRYQNYSLVFLEFFSPY
jgi:hypothetical protein